MPRLRPAVAAALAFAALAALWPARAAAQSIPPSGPGVTDVTLSNGLQVILKEDHASPVVAFTVWYRVGSRNERPGITGVSHLCEHMMFKGTRRYGKGEFSRMVKQNGGLFNAGTSNDYTVYFEVLASDRADIAIELEADRMQGCTFDEKEFLSERDVVREERRLRTEDQPFSEAFEGLMAAAFQAHPYHWPVVGWMSDLYSISRDDAYAYYKTYYAPNNAFIVAVGDFNTDDMLKKIKRHFGRCDREDPPPAVTLAEAPQKGERRVTLRRETQIQALAAAFHVPNIRDDDYYPLTLLQAVAAGGESSRFHKTLVKEKELAMIAGGFYMGDSVDPNLFLFFAAARPDKKIEDVEKALMEAIENLKNEPVGDRELQKAKNGLLAQQEFAQEGMEAQAMRIGGAHIGRDYRALDEYASKLRQVSAADLQRVAKKYFTEENRTVALLLPPREKSEGGGVAKAAGGRKEEHEIAKGRGKKQEPRPPKVTITSRDIRRVTLDNGLTVLVVERHSHPTVNVQCYLRSGAAGDPPGRSGVANFTAMMLKEGTKSRSSDEIAEAVDFIGASLGAGADLDGTTLSLSVLRQDLGEGLDLFADVIRRPSFPEKDLERVRGLIWGALQAEKDQPGTVADRAFRRLVYGDHPYSRRAEGDEAGVPKITRQDLADFYAAHYGPANAIIAVVGDVSADDLVAELTAKFGDWKGAGASSQAPSGIEASEGVRLCLIDKPLTQASIIFGHLGIPRKHPDFFAVRLMNDILGGGALVSRLSENIRENKGLAYDISSAFDAPLEPGTFRVTMQTKCESTNESLRSILEEIRKIREGGVTELELLDSKSFYTGVFPLTQERNSGVAGQLLTIEVHDLGLDYFERYPERILAVTGDDVQRAAREHLRPDRAQVVVVADQKAAAVDPRLLGESVVNVTPESLEPKAPVEPGESAAANDPVAETMIRDSIKAQGGEEGFDAVKDASLKIDASMVTPMGPMKADITLLCKSPDKILADIAAGPMKFQQGMNGKKRWAKVGPNVREVPAAEGEDEEGLTSGFRMLLPLARVLKGGATFARKGDGTVRDKACVIVECTDKDGETTLIYLDAATHLLVKTEGDAMTPQGKTRQETFYLDWKELPVGERTLQVPYRIQSLSNSKPSNDLKITELKVNTGLGDDLFEMPKAGETEGEEEGGTGEEPGK